MRPKKESLNWIKLKVRVTAQSASTVLRMPEETLLRSITPHLNIMSLNTLIPERVRDLLTHISVTTIHPVQVVGIGMKEINI